MIVYATRQHFALSATNSSLSAYCRFKYSRQFFSRYTVQEDPNWDAKDDTIRVSGQLLVKVSILCVLKLYDLLIQVHIVTAVYPKTHNCRQVGRTVRTNLRGRWRRSAT